LPGPKTAPKPGAIPLTVGILGFGRVARALCGLIAEQRERISALGVGLRIVAVASRRRGVAEGPEGLDLEALSAGGRDVPFRPWREGGDEDQGEGEDGATFARLAPGDVLVELTTTDVHSGQPAIAHVEAALKAGKHVVTANKGPVAWDYERLRAVASARRRAFLFEAAVMDGVPVFSLVRRCLPGCRVTGVRGVLNSTTNYILDSMAEGLSFEDSLAGAQALGIAEADPSLDIDGWDPAAKLCALANVLMGVRLTPPQVKRCGIRDVRPSDLRAARARGKTVRLICEARLSGHGATGEDPGPVPVAAVVEPREVDATDPLACVTGTSSVLTISTDLLGDLTITEKDPRLAQTAYGVLTDLLEVARLEREGSEGA